MIGLIEYMRLYENGVMLGKVLGIVQRPISLDMRVIMDNMNLMTEN